MNPMVIPYESLTTFEMVYILSNTNGYCDGDRKVVVIW